MRKLGVFWICHFLATVAGWYLLSALAQGAADSAAGATTPLIIFNAIMQILCFPVVLVALSVTSAFGGYSPGAFIAFMAVAAANSAVVAAMVATVVLIVRRLKSNPARDAPPEHDAR